MRAEREQLTFAQMVAGQDHGHHFIQLLHSHRRISISPLQAQYLERLKSGLTLEQLVLDYLKKGWLVRFSELFDLIQLLVTHDVLLNRSWHDLVKPVPAAAESGFALTAGTKIALNSEALKRLPFFHGLPDSLLNLFTHHSQRYEVPPNVRLCQQGQSSRDLFGLFRGEVAIFHTTMNGERRLVTKIVAPAVFGEGGFLLNRPRSADVVTTQPSSVIRFQHVPEFDKMIRSDTARNLHRRLWVLHALAHAPMFQNLPLEIWEDVALLGTIKPIRKEEICFREGERGASFHILVQGRLSVWQGGRQINTLEQGACFGEVSLFVSQGLRSATVKADLDSMVIEISAEQFYPLLARHLLLAKDLEQMAWRRIQDDRQRRSPT